MTAPVTEASQTAPGEPHRLPLAALIILALMGFILVAMETMPAGLLPTIAAGMNISEGTVGLFVSAYALGTVIVTVPAISLTSRFARKPLLVTGIVGLVLANTVTAFSSDVALSLSARFVAGAFSGIIWGMLAPYAVRISPANRAGVALAIVSVGAPLGFAFGTPLGAWIGTTFDWRWSFVGLSALAVVIAALVLGFVPNARGHRPTTRMPLARVFWLPGVPIVLTVIFVWMLAHSTIYTYIAPYLRTTGTAVTPELMLLVYGMASLAGVALTGLLLDRHPRALLHLSVITFIAAAIVLILGQASTPAILSAALLWGISFGGASPQLQNALSRAGGEHTDIANSFLPVAFNLAIFGAGIVGAILLVPFDGRVLPMTMAVLGLIVLGLTVHGRRTAFLPRS